MTAAFSICNVGIAFLVGMAGMWRARRGWLKL
jgi:hypothetical protein